MIPWGLFGRKGMTMKAVHAVRALKYIFFTREAVQPLQSHMIPSLLQHVPTLANQCKPLETLDSPTYTLITNKQTFKVWQPRRGLLESQRPNTPSDGTKTIGAVTHPEAEVLPTAFT
jgi:hypothetical protein